MRQADATTGISSKERGEQIADAGDGDGVQVASDQRWETLPTKSGGGSGGKEGDGEGEGETGEVEDEEERDLGGNWKWVPEVDGCGCLRGEDCFRFLSLSLFPSRGGPERRITL